MFKHKWVFTNWTIVSMAFTLLLCLAISAEAGMVSGRVRGADDNFEPGDEFIVFDAQERRFPVTTDQNRNYSILLPPGVYRVEFKKNDLVWEAWIQSSTQPVHQDIILRRR